MSSHARGEWVFEWLSHSSGQRGVKLNGMLFNAFYDSRVNLSPNLMEYVEYITDSASSSSGWVFGIPLGKVVANDSELRRRRAVGSERRESLDAVQQSSR
jgi:hypothetical protein